MSLITSVAVKHHQRKKERKKERKKARKKWMLLTVHELWVLIPYSILPPPPPPSLISHTDSVGVKHSTMKEEEEEENNNNQFVNLNHIQRRTDCYFVKDYWGVEAGGGGGGASSCSQNYHGSNGHFAGANKKEDQS